MNLQIGPKSKRERDCRRCAGSKRGQVPREKGCWEMGSVQKPYLQNLFVGLVVDLRDRDGLLHVAQNHVQVLVISLLVEPSVVVREVVGVCQYVCELLLRPLLISPLSSEE